MWKFMSSHDGVLQRSNDMGKKAVENGEGKYAFLMESASIEYTVERFCNLTQIGGLLDSKGYGIAARKDSPFRMPLSQAILQLQESGVLLILKERWWKQKKGGGQCMEDHKKGSGSVTPLKIDNVGGVFVVLLGGLSFSLFVAIMEFMWKARNFTIDQDTICEEMLSDLKFAFSCQSSSKSAKPRLEESASIEYTVERFCNLTQIGGLLDSKGYGIAARKDSPFRMPLSQAILQLQESGVLLILKERWWKQKKGGGQCMEDHKKGSGSVTPLKIDNVGGVFVVLLGGLSFSLFVAIMEFMWKARNFTIDQDTICEEMLSDLKFAFSCQSSSKSAKPRLEYKYDEKSGLPPQLGPHFSTIY
ncbi:unnamed protein product [Medioppia subpectinata]|uniref:Ionotropic glutamate receptor C-terminal domain-containing protein n=1 Tax=Medioppia subpectinata TaxID=1979941 RepID=A0A7R9KYD1_9ACAR|nr:unnamed protein product [Medioppia subpectinata]CAG2111798.1 unnamed protein product [Medioppia subpectinata]